MSTSELAILHGASLPFLQKDDEIKDFCWVNKWTTFLKNALQDIELIYADNVKQYRYWKHKLVYILLTKTLSQDKNIKLSGNIEEHFDVFMYLFPRLNWCSFFIVVDKLNLYSEFSAIYNTFSKENIDYVYYQLNIFLCDCISAHNSIEKLSPVDVTTFAICLFCANLENLFENCKTAFISKLGLQTLSQMKSFFLLNSITPVTVTKINHALDLTNVFIRNNKCNNRSQIHLDINLLHLHNLKKALVVYKNTKLLNAFENLSSKKKNIDIQVNNFLITTKTSNGECEKIIEAFSESLLFYVEKISKESEACQREFCSILQKIVDLLSNNASKPQEHPLVVVENNVILYGLKNFQKIALEKLRSSQEEYFALNLKCLLLNPLCVATPVSLKEVMKVIRTNDNSSQQDFKMMDNLMLLFVSSFDLLCLKNQIEILQDMVDSQNFLIFEVINKCSLFNCYGREITAFFNCIAMDKVTDDLLAHICHMFLLSPRFTIEKIVKQGICDERQQSFLINLLKKLPFIGKMKINELTHLSKSLFEDLNAAWINNDSERLQNTLKYLSKTLNIQKSLHINMLEEILKYYIIPSLFKEKKIQSNINFILSDTLIPQLLLCITNSISVTNCWSIKDLLILSFRLGILVDEETEKWHKNNLNFDNSYLCSMLNVVDILVENLQKELEINNEDCVIKKHLIWFEKAIQTLKWTTQLYFKNLFEFFDYPYIRVPSCITEVHSAQCNMLLPSEDLDYGRGTGLLPWLQCFSVCPGLCPINDLKIKDCNAEELVLFEKGLTITLAQVLPYSTPEQWDILTKALKILVIHENLYIQYDCTMLSHIPLQFNLVECKSSLQLMQLFTNVGKTVLGNCSNTWMSSSLLFYYTKCFCNVIADLFTNCNEFEKAGLISQLFILTQIFHQTLQYLLNLEKIQHRNSQTIDLVVYLLLSILNSVQEYVGQNTKSDEMSLLSDSTVSNSDISICTESTLSGITQYFVFREFIHIMKNSVLMIKNNKMAILNQKLSKIMEIIN